MRKPQQKVTRYTVSLFEEDDGLEKMVHDVTVEWTGPETWAVRWMGRSLSADEQWDLEPIPSSRTLEWLTANRFPLGDALDRAMAAAPEIYVNGRTAAQRAEELYG